MENHHRNSEFSHWKWWLSIVMLACQRVLLKKRGSTKPLKTRSSSQPAVGRCEKVLLVHVETQPLPSIVFKRFRETTHSKSSDRKVNRTCPGSKTSLNFSPISPQNTRGNNSHRESLATSLLPGSTESDSWWPSGNSTSIAHWINNLPIKLVISIAMSIYWGV